MTDENNDEKRKPGRPPLPKELQVIQNLTRKDLIEVASRILKMTPLRVERLAESRRASMLEVTIARILLRERESGLGKSLAGLLDRVCGKPPIIAAVAVADASAQPKLSHQIIFDAIQEINRERALREGMPLPSADEADYLPVPTAKIENANQEAQADDDREA